MQVFIVGNPLETAMILDSRRLNKQIIETEQIIKAITGESKAWNNHPVVKPYSEGSLMFLCQMHKEKHPSMGVTDARGVFYCFSCGVNGTVVNYLEEYERLTYNEVISL